MKICVYGASSPHIDSRFINAGERLGEEMAKKNIGLVFGGGDSGMMGAVARGAYRYHGEIIGIAPEFFNVDGVLFAHCGTLLRPKTMRERKKLLEEYADGFIVTPGGIGTFDELFEILTLKELGCHSKPIAVYNAEGVYDGLLNCLDELIKKKFIHPEVRSLLFVSDDIENILDYLQTYTPPEKSVKDLRGI